MRGKILFEIGNWVDDGRRVEILPHPSGLVIRLVDGVIRSEFIVLDDDNLDVVVDRFRCEVDRLAGA